MEACSAYAIAHTEPERFVDAVNTVFGRLERAVLVVEPRGTHLFFAVQHDAGRHTTHVGKHDLDVSPLSALAGTPVIEVYGNSATDDVELDVYEQGHRRGGAVTTVGELREIDDVGVDLEALYRWGELSIGGGEPAGARFALLLQVTPELERLFQQIDPEALATQAASLEQSGRPWPHIVRGLHQLGLTDRAAAIVHRQPVSTLAERTQVFEAYRTLGRLHRVKAWAQDRSALRASHRRELIDALDLVVDDYYQTLFDADLEKLDEHLERFVVKGDVTDPGGLTYPRWGLEGPVTHLLMRACGAEVEIRYLRPYDQSLLDELERHEIPELTARAEALRSLVAELQGERRVPYLRRLLTHCTQAKPWERRVWTEALALALAKADDPEAVEWLERAYAGTEPDSPVRPQLIEAMRALGIEPEIDEEASSHAGLPEPTPEAEAALTALLEVDDSSLDHQARVALARFAAGRDDAEAALESVYLELSYNSPHRAAMESAMHALGMI